MRKPSVGYVEGRSNSCRRLLADFDVPIPLAVLIASIMSAVIGFNRKTAGATLLREAAC